MRMVGLESADCSRRCRQSSPTALERSRPSQNAPSVVYSGTSELSLFCGIRGGKVVSH